MIIAELMFTIFPKTRIKVVTGDTDYSIYISSRSNALFNSHGFREINKIYTEDRWLVFDVKPTIKEQKLDDSRIHSITLSQVLPFIDGQKAHIKILNKEGISIHDIDCNAIIENIYIANDELCLVVC